MVGDVPRHEYRAARGHLRRFQDDVLGDQVLPLRGGGGDVVDVVLVLVGATAVLDEVAVVPVVDDVAPGTVVCVLDVLVAPGTVAVGMLVVVVLVVPPPTRDCSAEQRTNESGVSQEKSVPAPEPVQDPHARSRAPSQSAPPAVVQRSCS
jgi:hypothetical protein